MSLLNMRIALLRKAAATLKSVDVAPYFKLKGLLRSGSPACRAEFEATFSRFYGLNSGGVGPEFRRRYFDLLFSLRGIRINDRTYADLLTTLHAIERLKGDRALAASFVSKLVAMHDESRPPFDRHVSNFFGLVVPSAGSLECRIEGFIAHLATIRREYVFWLKDPLENTLKGLRARIPELKACHEVRVCDFLVWTVGRNRLWETTAA